MCTMVLLPFLNLLHLFLESVGRESFNLRVQIHIELLECLVMLLLSIGRLIIPKRVFEVLISFGVLPETHIILITIFHHLINLTILQRLNKLTPLTRLLPFHGRKYI